MKIQEMERLCGVTRKNIRFYEQEGLLAPGRNRENGYREYAPEDLKTLARIKLLRKLAVPIAEIRRMQDGSLTVSDGLRRHIITLERERENLELVTAMCERMTGDETSYAALDADKYLVSMEEMEQKGARFMNVQKNDTSRRKLTGAVIAAAVMLCILLLLVATFVWLCLTEEAPPWPMLILLFGGLAAVIVGVLVALRQRIREIQGGEEDAAGQY